MQNIVTWFTTCVVFFDPFNEAGAGGNDTHCTNEDTEAHRSKITCL